MLDLSKFFEYGIGAGMFVVSVGLLIIVFKYFTKANKETAKEFMQSVEMLDSRHRDERESWQKSEDRRQKQANDVVLRLDQTIREILIKESVSK